MVLIEDEPIKSTHGKGCGRGRGKTRLAGKENTYYTATSVEDETGVMKRGRGRGRGRGERGGGVGGGNGRGGTTHYVSDSDDDSVPAVTLIEEGPKTGKRPAHRPQVIDSSDDQADEGEGRNEVQSTASTSCTAAPMERGGHTQRNFNPIRHNPDREFRGWNRHLEEDTDAYSTDEELRPYDNRAPTGQQEKNKIAQNPPTYVFLNKAKWCNGCKMPFTETFYTAPMNLVFHFKTIVEWYQDGEYHRSRGPQNAYYHARDLGCL